VQPAAPQAGDSTTSPGGKQAAAEVNPGPASALTDESRSPSARFSDDASTSGSARSSSTDTGRDADVASRYLGNRAEATDGQTTPRELRRPVDVFFPDRRHGEDTNAAAPAGHAKKSKSRPSMPSMSPMASLKSPVSKRQSAGYAEAEQPSSVDLKQKLGSGTLNGATADTPVPQAAPEARQFGSARNAELRSIPVAEIHPNPRQPREVFDEDAMDELVASIREVGVLQPIVVRAVDGPTPFELVMGERRWRASQSAGLQEIPAIVRHTEDTDLLRDALLENLHRSQLNPLEEAAAYDQLLEDFACTQDELSSRIGRSRPQITNTLRLLKLPPLVQRRVASGVLSAGHARALLGLVDPGEMEKLAQKIVAEGMSVRATEELVSLHDGVRQAKPKARAPRTQRHERLDYLASSLTDSLDTTVKITLGARKGKIAIDFASVDDLNRIMDLIQPSVSNNN
jgi:ParB family transcriptional regulator, chromosome partitioning protein